MDLVHDFDIDVDYVMEMCEKRVSSYPFYIRDLGLSYLEKLHLVKDKNSRRGGFCYLMPFWLKDSFNIDSETCRIIALGNIFGLLYFMSQDEVIDNRSSGYEVSLSPLSTMFFLDFTAQYRLIFSSDSLFWSYFEKYIGEWSQSVAWEHKKHWRHVEVFSEEDFILLSRKAAPFKIPFAAIGILAGNEQKIQAFSDMMDYDQVVYQIIDDWRDWREDLSKGNFTYFLMKAMEYCNIRDSSDLTETHVKKAIYIGNITEKVMEIAKKYNRLSRESISKVKINYLEAYLQLEADLYNKILTDLKEEKEVNLKGGFDKLLWNLMRKT